MAALLTGLQPLGSLQSAGVLGPAELEPLEQASCSEHGAPLWSIASGPVNTVPLNAPECESGIPTGHWSTLFPSFKIRF